MVKKSGFLDKIVGRFRSGSLRVENGRGGSSPASRGRGNPVPAKAVPEEIIPSSKRKLSPKEDAQLAMNRSFKELSSLLGGVQTRMESQGGKLDEMNANVARLPAAAEAQVEMLQALVAQMDKQNAMNGKMVETFAELPNVMKGVQESLARSAATDDRTAQTLDDFRGTMDRIQDSMGDMVQTSAVQAQVATDIAADHRETVSSMKTVTQDGLEALRTAQEDQANRMTRIIGETGRANRVIVVLLILSFGAMVAILAALMNGQ